MDGKVMLARLCARGLQIVDPIRGGKVEISPAEIAAALGYGALGRAPYYLALAKYCDDGLALLELRHAHLAPLLMRTCLVSALPDPLLHGLLDLLCAEGLHAPLHGRCQGRGCDGCQGTGVRRQSDRERARLVGVAKTTYQRRWRHGVDRALCTMEAWDQAALGHLYHQFARTSEPA